MTVEIEDGSGKADATSFSSTAALSAYHTARGRTLNAGNLDALLIEATDGFEVLFAANLGGSRAVADQRLSFPRVGLVDALTGDEVPSTGAESIPLGLQEGVFELAWEIDQKGSPFVSPKVDKTGQRVKRRKLEDLEIEYQESGATQAVRSMPAVSSKLDRYLTGGLTTATHIRN